MKHSLVTVVILLVLPAALGQTTPAPVARPPAAQDGDVVLAQNNACSNTAWLMCSQFFEALHAWRTRALFTDTSPGAVPVTGPPNFTVGWDMRDNGGIPGVGVSNSVAGWMQRSPPVHALIGLGSSSATMASAQLGHHTKHVIVGYASGNALLSKKDEYGFFMRTCPPDSLQAAGMVALTLKFVTTKIALIYLHEAYSAGIYSHFRDRAPTTLQLYAEGLVSQLTNFDPSKWTRAFGRLAARKERYTVCMAGSVEFWAVANATGLLTPDRQWIGDAKMVSTPLIDYTMIVGAIGVRPVSEGALIPEWKKFMRTMSIDQFPEMVTNQQPSPLTQGILYYGFTTFYDSFLVDATMSVLFAIERLHAAGVPLSECRGDKLRVELRRTSFEGVSGLVEFDENGDRAASYQVWNVIPGSKGWKALKGRGFWSVSTGVVTGGWEGKLEDPRFQKLIFTHNVSQPLPVEAAGCPRGEKYLGWEIGCAPCEVGTFNPTDNSVEPTCLPCGAGMHAPTEGMSVCAVCPVGSFQNATGQSTCDECESGTYAIAVGAEHCEMCAKGLFSGIGATVCSSCPEGTFASSEGQSQCQPCPAGFTTELIGSILPAACACPVNTLFVPSLINQSLTVAPQGSCFHCDLPADLDKFNDGLHCPGGRSCEAIHDRTILSSFPCAGLVDCLDKDGCTTQCMLPIARAREVCNSYDFHNDCEGWVVKTAAFRHLDMLPDPDSRLGWQNVAILGRIIGGDLSSYGKPSTGWSLTPKRSLCSPLVAGDPALLKAQHVKHTVWSYPQPPLMRPGYYMPDVAAVELSGLPSSITGREADGTPKVATDARREALRKQQVDLTTRLAQPWAVDYYQLLAADPPKNGVAAADAPRTVPLFKCASATICPGGLPGQCFPGQTGLNCAQCVAGFYSSSTTGCARCTGGDFASVFFALLLIVAMAILVLLYKMTLNPLAAQLSAKITTSLAIGLTFNGLQTFGVISLMNFDFGEPLSGILSSLRLFLFDIDQLQWECLMSVTPMGKLSVRIVAPPVVCLLYLALFISSRLLHVCAPTRVTRWTVPHTLNCTGMVLQVLFISICMGVIMPFKCAQHPVGGVLTLVDIPYQPCGVGDHVPMSAIGTAFIFLYPVLALALCSYVVYILPAKTAADPTFLNYFKFLVSRFRFDRYYFGIIFMLRNLGIAMVPVLNPNNPFLQQVVMASILLVSLCCQALLWPWAANEVNFLDTACLLSMIMTVLLSAGKIDSKTIDDATMTIVALLSVSAAFVLMAVVVLHATLKVVAGVLAQRKMCLKLTARLRKEGRNEAELEEMSVALKNVTGVLGNWNKKNLYAFIAVLPLYDRAALGKVLSMLLGAIEIDPATLSDRTGHSSKALRITVQRFKRRSSLQIGDDELSQAQYKAALAAAASGSLVVNTSGGAKTVAEDLSQSFEV